MKKTHVSVLIMAVVISFLSSTASAGLIDSWLDFVDAWGFSIGWKFIYWYTFMWPFTFFYCGLGLDKEINERIGKA